MRFYLQFESILRKSATEYHTGKQEQKQRRFNGQKELVPSLHIRLYYPNIKAMLNSNPYSSIFREVSPNILFSSFPLLILTIFLQVRR